MFFFTVLISSIFGLFAVLDAQQTSMSEKELNALVTGSTIQALIPTLAKNADSEKKVSPACIQKLLFPGKLATDRGAALIFKKEEKYPRLLYVATPFGAFPCLTEKSVRIKVGNPFSQKRKFLYRQVDKLIKTNPTIIEIPEDPTLYALAIESVPGIHRITHEAGLRNFFTFNPADQTRSIQQKERTNASEDLLDLWEAIKEERIEFTQVIKKATEQLSHATFDEIDKDMVKTGRFVFE